MTSASAGHAWLVLLLASCGPPAGPVGWQEEGARRGLNVSPVAGTASGQARYLLEETGTGCAFLDHDGDGDLDVYWLESGRLRPVHGGKPRPGLADVDSYEPARDGLCRLFQNDGHGHFKDVTEETAAGLSDFACGVSVADYDNDGDEDLYVTCFGPNRLLRNDGGVFREVGGPAGVADPRWSIGSCWLDADLDGDLDLYVANYFAMSTERDPECWRKVDCPYHDLRTACGPKGMVAERDGFFLNRGDGTFEDGAAAWGMEDVEARYGMGVISLDADQDGYPDVYVANDSRGNFLWRNDGGRRFVERGDLAGLALSRKGQAQAGMGIACGDLDGDLDEDLFLTNFSHDLNTLYRNDGALSFLDVSEQAGMGREDYFALGWGTEFLDLDNDGGLELFVANGHIYPEADQRAPELSYRQRNRVFGCSGDRLVDQTLRFEGLTRRESSRGVAVGDIDHDGDLDLLVAEQGAAPSLLINPHPVRAGRAVLVELEGTADSRDAVGVRGVATVGGRRLLRVVRRGQSYASQHDHRLHFGLGAELEVSRLEVHWLRGPVEVFLHLPAGHEIRIRQGVSGFGARPLEPSR